MCSFDWPERDSNSWPVVLVVVEDDALVGGGDVDDVFAALHRPLDARVVAQHDVHDDQLAGTVNVIAFDLTRQLGFEPILIFSH